MAAVSPRARGDSSAAAFSVALVYIRPHQISSEARHADVFPLPKKWRDYHDAASWASQFNAIAVGGAVSAIVQQAGAKE